LAGTSSRACRRRRRRRRPPRGRHVARARDRRPESVVATLVPKGSITVAGASLTINEVAGDRFSVTLIPHTLAVTTLGTLTVGAAVNLEGDLIASTSSASSRRASTASRKWPERKRRGESRPAGSVPMSVEAKGAAARGSDERMDAVRRAIDDVRAGRMVILVDDEDRENEGDLVLAADLVTPEAINFMARTGAASSACRSRRSASRPSRFP